MYKRQGYPGGLLGEQIPLESRIVAVADSFDALASERPYHPALPVEQVRRIMRSENGTHFDPHLFAAFDAAFERFETIHREFADHGQSLAAQACELFSS